MTTAICCTDISTKTIYKRMVDSYQNVKSLMILPSNKYHFTLIITTSNYDIDPIKNNTYFTS